ncbi:MAG TPA: hypothetical protein VFE93_02440, partial [Myxococcaceae bacterium]|nr:hypothetical protein [Myxococcaceae bacterium]
MTPITPGPGTVQLIERSDREREALQLILESLGLQVEVFTSLAERAQRAPGSGQCLLCAVDGVGQRWREFDGLLAEMGEGMPV